MIEPAQHLGNGLDLWPVRNEGTPHHHDRQAELTRSVDFCRSGIAAGVTGDDNIDAMVGQHLAVAGKIERTARNDHFCLERQRRPWLIDQPDQIEMLLVAREWRELGATDAEEHAAGSDAQCMPRRHEIVDLDPAVARAALPGPPLERKQGNADSRAGRDCMRAHPGRKGMRGIDDTYDLFAAKIVDQPVDTAKAAEAPGNWRLLRAFGPPGIGQNGIEARIARNRRRKLVGIGAAAKDQHAQWFGRRGRHALER